MTFLLTREGRVQLRCDVEPCTAQFTINAVGAHKTRAAAGNRGWHAATREDRRDFCPEHLAEAAEAPPCGVRFYEADDERCTKPAGHELAVHGNGRYAWGDALVVPEIVSEGIAEFARPAAPERLTGGLLDLLEDVPA